MEAERLERAIRAADPEARGVILFGSVAEGNPSREDFDIDLALDGGDTYRALDAIEDSEFKVDIVNLESLPTPLREVVLAKGIRLGER